MIVTHRNQKTRKSANYTYFCTDEVYKVVLKFSSFTDLPIGFLKMKKTTAIQLFDINNLLIQEVVIRRNKNTNRELDNMVSDFAEDYVFKNFLNKPVAVEIQS